MPDEKTVKGLSFEAAPGEEYRMFLKGFGGAGAPGVGKLLFNDETMYIPLDDAPTPAKETLALLSDPTILQKLRAIKELTMPDVATEQASSAAIIAELKARLAETEASLAALPKAAAEAIRPTPEAPIAAEPKPVEVESAPSAPGGQRITFTLPNDAIDFLKKEASRTHQSMADIVRRAIANERYLREMSTGKRSLLVEEAGKPLTRLVFRD